MKIGTMQKGSKCMMCGKEIDFGVETFEGDICIPCVDREKETKSVLDIVSGGV